MGSKIDVMKGGDERILLPMFLLGTLVIVGIVLECERFFNIVFPFFNLVQNMKQMFFRLWLSLAILYMAYKLYKDFCQRSLVT